MESHIGYGSVFTGTRPQRRVFVVRERTPESERSLAELAYRFTNPDIADRRLQELWDELWAEIGGPILALVNREVPLVQDRDDVLQDIRYEIWKERRASNRWDGRLYGAYTYGLARNVIRADKRKLATWTRFITKLVTEPVETVDRANVRQAPQLSTHDDYFRAEADWALLHKTFQRLNENEREALILQLIEGRTYEEIAIILNVDDIKSLLYRARKKLRKGGQAR